MRRGLFGMVAAMGIAGLLVLVLALSGCLDYYPKDCSGELYEGLTADITFLNFNGTGEDVAQRLSDGNYSTHFNVSYVKPKYLVFSLFDLDGDATNSTKPAAHGRANLHYDGSGQFNELIIVLEADSRSKITGKLFETPEQLMFVAGPAFQMDKAWLGLYVALIEAALAEDYGEPDYIQYNMRVVSQDC